MATQSTVTGPIQAPTATTPTRGFIRFQLTDWDAEGGTIITTTKVEAPISNEDFSISLWASSEGDRGTNYKVTAFWYNATEDKWVQDEMGYCSVGNVGPYSLGDILVDDPIEPTPVDVLAEAQAALVAASAGAARAEAAADEAETSADLAATYAGLYGRNPILYDESGNASVMVRIPAFTLDEIDPSLGSGLHPAFIVGGVEKSEIYIGKYLASLASDGLAVSLPGVDPKASINFNAADAACSGKGAGWHMMTNAEWSALALWSWKNGTMPRGNAAYGRSYVYGHETGVRQDGVIPGESSGIARTLTGTGPAAWNHDFTDSGVSDLCGNVWEWQRGYRLVDSEIQIIPDNDAAATGADNSSTSALWKAILPNGSLVAPGTAGTLKWDSGVTLNTTAMSSGAPSAMYKDISAASGVSVPALLKVLGIFPHDTTIDRGRVYINVEGERMPGRGGYWHNGGNAGVFACYLRYVRSDSYSSIGFRPAYVE